MRRSVVLLGAVLALVAFGGGCADEATLDTTGPWDLVWFSDSSGWFVADQWANRIEEDLGVEVRVHDHAEGGLSLVEVLDSLDGEDDGSHSRLPDLREEVANAEIVVVYGNPVDSGATTDIETCVSTDTTPRQGPTHYSEADWDPYREILDSIFETVVDLRGDQPTIVRAIDLYVPVIADWRDAGILNECTQAWEMWSQVIQDTASAYGIETVSMFNTFNGADHTEDPREKGYIGSDGEHTLPVGQSAMVEALHARGYTPSILRRGG